MATVDSDKVVCGGIHAMIVAVLVCCVLIVDTCDITRRRSLKTQLVDRKKWLFNEKIDLN
jgi:hypothetical protein